LARRIDRQGNEETAKMSGTFGRRALLAGAGGLAATASIGRRAIPTAYGAPPEAPVTLKLADSGAETWQGNVWAHIFADTLTKQAPAVRVEIYPNAELGQDPALAQAVQMGTIDINVTGPQIEQNVPGLAVFDMPFLFETLEQEHHVQDGPIGAQIAADCLKAGFRVIGWFDIGMRNVSSNRGPINSAADFKGLKIRVPPGPVFLATFQALGASVQAIDFGELYTALQQGVVDAEENPAMTLKTMKFYEVQKYFSLTRHMASFSFAVMNPASYDKQTKAVRDAIDEAAAIATREQRDNLAKGEAGALAFCQQNGIIVNTPTDRQSMIEATKGVLQNASPEVQAYTKAIRAVI